MQTGLMSEWTEFSSRQGQRFSSSWPVLRSPHVLSSGQREGSVFEVKGLALGGTHLLPSSVEVKNARCCTSAPPHVSISDVQLRTRTASRLVSDLLRLFSR
jgi:hypothetical protein